MERLFTPGSLKKGVNLTRQVHSLLRQMILRVQILPNATISDRDVAAQLGISKTPVREAFIRLEDEGLIRVVPKSRTYVAPIDLERFHEGFFVRSTLERAAVVDAALHRSFEDVCQLEACITRQRAAAKTEAYWDFFHLDEQLHAIIFRAAGVTGAWDIVNSAKVEIDRVRSLKIVFGVRNLGRVISDHEAVVSAITKRDPDAAAAAMGAHLGSIESKISELTASQDFWEFFERVNAGVERHLPDRDAALLDTNTHG